MIKTCPNVLKPRLKSKTTSCPMKNFMRIFILSVILMAFLLGCSGQKLDVIAMDNERIIGCSSRPNCVSTEAEDARHLIAPFLLKGDTTAGWNAIRSIIASMPRTKIIKTTDHYLHAECRSRVFGFIDDLELKLDPAASIIKIRSASRIGYSDFGVNRRRIEALRQQLKDDELIHQ